MIKHISFDVWNTLITANPQYAYERTEIISDFGGVPPKEANAAYAHVKRVLDTEAENMVCGDEYNAWYKLGRYLGVNRQVAEEMKIHCEKAFLAYPPCLNEDFVDQLIYLSFNYELSIKSNTNFISGRILSEAMGFDRMPWWNFMHFSDEHLLCKPDILFFAKTLLESNLDELSNYEILHIGDSEIYDGKCVDLGFKFCHIKNPEDLLNKLVNGEVI